MGLQIPPDRLRTLASRTRHKDSSAHRGRASDSLNSPLSQQATGITGEQSLLDHVSRPSRTRLSSIHTFRGLSIVLVVATHCLSMFTWTGNSVIGNAVLDLVANATMLFMFVSGYLFQHLSHNFGYWPYLKRKFEHVLVPYLIVATPAVLYTAVMHDPVPDYPFLAGSSRAYDMLWLYVTGGTHINFPLWFVPMICVFFVFSPVFCAIVRYPRLYLCLVALVPLALLAHRPSFPNPPLMHSVIYFLPAYVLGMAASQYRVQVDDWLDRYLGWLCFAFVVFFLVHLFASNQHGNYEVSRAFSFETGYVDWALLQKLVFALLLLGLLNRYDQLVASSARPLGDHAYSIYLVHAYVMYGIHVATRWHEFRGGLIMASVMTAVVVSVSLVVSSTAQKLLGKHSVFVIGS
jgi:peptidoglycan/LPS O-acetylase OafA/YrhL